MVSRPLVSAPRSFSDHRRRSTLMPVNINARHQRLAARAHPRAQDHRDDRAVALRNRLHHHDRRRWPGTWIHLALRLHRRRERRCSFAARRPDLPPADRLAAGHRETGNWNGAEAATQWLTSKFHARGDKGSFIDCPSAMYRAVAPSSPRYCKAADRTVRAFNADASEFVGPPS